MANVPPRNFKRLAASERNLRANGRQPGAVYPNELIEVSVYLRDPATSRLVGDSSEYAQQPGQRITRAEYVAKHSATPDDLAKVEAFAREHNLTIVETDPVGRKVVLSGTAAALMTAFGTDLQRYEYEGGTFRGRTGHLHIPSELDQIVVGVFGLYDPPQPPPHLRYYDPATTVVRTGAGTTSYTLPRIAYTPSQLSQLYNFPTGLDGRGQCIALIELGGGYSDQDLNTYFQQLGIPMPQVISVPVDGAQNSPPRDPNIADAHIPPDFVLAGS